MAETLTWVDADGGTHPLTDDNGARVLKGMEGRFMPPIALIEEEVPFQPGAVLRHTKTMVREVAIPVVFLADDASALRLALRDWLSELNVDRGPGKLRVDAPDGTSRELNATYSGGMEIVEDDTTSGETFQKAVIVFRAHDPYWYDRDDLTATFTEDGESVTFFPFFPLELNSSELNSPTSVLNDGDAEIWPTWEITGPGIDPLIRNLTTGEEIDLTHTLPSSSDTVTIDTRPGVKTVEDETGASLYTSLSLTSSLFALARGTNSLTVEMSGTGPDTLVVMRYRRRFLSA